MPTSRTPLDLGQEIFSAKVVDNAFQVSGPCQQWVLHRHADMESLWNQMDNSSKEDTVNLEERLPYWTELWPSSLGLALWLYEQRDVIKETPLCLDMGCGLGYTALVGAALGTKVIAMDYIQEALPFAVKNKEANFTQKQNQRNVLFTCMDWRKPAILPKSIDLIWAGDIMYEASFALPIANFLKYALKPQGKAWIAEPGREVYNNLPRIIEDIGLSCKKVAIRSAPNTFTGKESGISIWEISPVKK